MVAEVDGMNPRNWVENDARREERRQRLARDHGAASGPTTRAIVGWVIATAAIALAGYAMLVLVGAIAAPG